MLDTFKILLFSFLKWFLKNNILILLFFISFKYKKIIANIFYSFYLIFLVIQNLRPYLYSDLDLLIPLLQWPFINLMLSKAISPCFHSIVLASKITIKFGGCALNSIIPCDHSLDWCPLFSHFVFNCPVESFLKETIDSF